MSSEGRFPCPCCFYLTFDECPPGTFDICPICGWEDDDWAFRDHERSGGANAHSLRRARAEFEAMLSLGEPFQPPLSKQLPRLLPHENKDAWLGIVARSLIDGDNPPETVLQRFREYGVTLDNVKRYLMKEYRENPDFLSWKTWTVEELASRLGYAKAKEFRQTYDDIELGVVWLNGDDGPYLLDDLFNPDGEHRGSAG